LESLNDCSLELIDFLAGLEFVLAFLRLNNNSVFLSYILSSVL